MVEMWDCTSKQTTTDHTLIFLSKQHLCGASTGIDGHEAYNIFSEVVNHLANVDAR